MEEQKKVIYIADFDQDVDDIIAVEYLAKLNLLSTVVADPYPTEPLGVMRLEGLKWRKTFTVKDSLPEENLDTVIVGGALTQLAEHIRKGYTIGTLIMNGGFVGANIVPLDEQLDKFRHKKYVRTYNFNLDVDSTDFVMKTSYKQISKIILIGKNVCHNDCNTKDGIWQSDDIALSVLNKYNVRDNKKQHDLLACYEGLVKQKILHGKPFCKYTTVCPITEHGLDGKMTKWGSTKNMSETPYRMVLSAVGYE